MPSLHRPERIFFLSMAPPEPLPPGLPATFPWEDCEQICLEFDALQEAPSHGMASRAQFQSGVWCLVPPLVLSLGQPEPDLTAWIPKITYEPGLQVVVCLQAGATSLGLFEAGAVVRTKTIKRYVVRGKGRAQPTHLNTKGKSRYGSRLRLQNAKAILEETSEKLRDWWEEYGEPEVVFYNAPVRLWADLMRAQPAVPFEEIPLVKIPLDLPKPTTDVLLRAYRSLCYGQIRLVEQP